MTPRASILPLVCVVVLALPASARTIILTDADCERMAFIQAGAPLWGWGGYDITTDQQSTGQLYLSVDRAFLICFPLDKIPKGQKILKAELTFTTVLQSGGEQRLNVWRILQPWGAGVCWRYVAQRPKKVEWKQAGGKAAGADRPAKPSAILRTTENGVKTLNVTEDVELWYTKAAQNQGWMLTVDDPDVLISLASPVWSARGSFKLQITFEPE
jgi:hypothetical protein